jgi:hypothetical protein
MLAVGAWFTVLAIVLVLLYFRYRDLKTRRNKVGKKVKPTEEKTASDKSYTIVINEDGSVQVVFTDGESGETFPSGKLGVVASYRGAGKEGETSTGKSKTAKVFADRCQMMKFLGGTITCDLPEIIPDEKGTYALILHVWKNTVNPIEAPIDKAGKKCKSCGTQNDSDAKYCKKCGKQLK